MNNKLLVVFLNTIIFTVAFNSPIVIQYYLDYQIISSTILVSTILKALLALAFVFPLIYICSCSRFLIIFIYILSGLSSYFMYKLNIQINQELIASFFEASSSEVTNFLNLDLFLSLINAIILALFCFFSIKQSTIEKSENKKINFICFVFVAGCLLGDSELMTNFLPFNNIKQTTSYLLEKTSISKKRLNIAESFEHQLEDTSKDLNIILIIGESARVDHFSLENGYNRKTNPLLEEEKNLIYFKQVTACYPLTRIAVPCMITRATRENRSASLNESSFIGIFKKLGFYTYWLGMQGALSAIDAPYIDLAKEANKTLLPGTDIELEDNDSNLLKFVDQFYNKEPQGPNLLILHTIGSHFHYEDRAPLEFRKFTPTCLKKKFMSSMTHCTKEELINSYDNSILYTDHFIKKVIDQVRDKNALVIYTPDHGESLGENGRFLHGTHNSGEQIAVPLIFWASNKYIKNYPNKFNKLKQLKNKNILHDHLFHSIIGCSGIKSEILDKELNLCN